MAVIGLLSVSSILATDPEVATNPYKYTPDPYKSVPSEELRQKRRFYIRYKFKKGGTYYKTGFLKDISRDLTVADLKQDVKRELFADSRLTLGERTQFRDLDITLQTRGLRFHGKKPEVPEDTEKFYDVLMRQVAGEDPVFHVSFVQREKAPGREEKQEIPKPERKEQKYPIGTEVVNVQCKAKVVGFDPATGEYTVETKPAVFKTPLEATGG